MGNLSLRAITIGLKFVLIFGVSKYYSTEDLGLYGLFTTNISVLMFFVGFDFYTYAHRELLVSPISDRGKIVSHSLIFFLFTYLVVCPLSFFVIFGSILPIKVMLWLYVLLVFEHLSQELFRILILFGNQYYANFLFFIRSSSWILPVLLYWYISEFQNLELDWIFLFWTLGSFVSVILGAVKLRQYLPPKPFQFTTFDYGWLKSGMPVALKFLVGTLAFKVVEFSDRYFIDQYLDKETVGIYTLYYSFANVVQTLVFTLVIAEMYPKVTQYYLNGDFASFKSYRRLFERKVWVISIIAAILVFILIFPALNFIGKLQFFSELETFALLLFAVFLLNVSFVPHYILYAFKMDTEVMICTVIAAVINITANFILIKSYGIVGTAISAVISYAFLLIVKYYLVYARES